MLRGSKSQKACACGATQGMGATTMAEPFVVVPNALYLRAISERGATSPAKSGTMASGLLTMVNVLLAEPQARAMHLISPFRDRCSSAAAPGRVAMMPIAEISDNRMAAKKT